MHQFDRYDRQIILPGFGQPTQQRLHGARVLVIGAGGLGSTVIPSLAAAGVGHLGLIDDDFVEVSNLHRQVMHGMEDVGRPKVGSAGDTVRALNPEVEVEIMPDRLTSANALELFGRHDLVIDGSDNFPTRYLADDAATISGIPLVWGAVSQYGGQVGVSWPEQGPGYRDLFPVAPRPGSVLNCADGGVFPTTVAVIGSLMATEALKILTGVGTPFIGRVVVFDGLRGGFRELQYARDPDVAPVTGLIDYDIFCGVVPTIAPIELADVPVSEITLLDVREPWEAEIVSLPGSVLAPLATLDAVVGDLDRSKPVIVYCHRGIRSQAACELLIARGLDARNLAGGIDAWSRQVDTAMARY
jgi:sulfur-carrier protein adenylyltransferase/sulfurtransferase